MIRGCASNLKIFREYFPAFGATMFGRLTRRISNRWTTRVDHPGRKSLGYSIRYSGAADNGADGGTRLQRNSVRPSSAIFTSDYFNVLQSKVAILSTCCNFFCLMLLLSIKQNFLFV